MDNLKENYNQDFLNWCQKTEKYINSKKQNLYITKHCITAMYSTH